MADIRISELPLATGPTAPTGTDFLAIDGLTTRKTPISALGDVAVPIASQAEAEAGVNATKRMVPVTVKQSIASEVGVTLASKAQGDLASTALQPGQAATPSQGALADTALQAGDAATPTQGAKADTATQPFDINERLDASGLSRAYLARDKDKPWSVEEFGDYVNSSADHTALIQAAFDSSIGSIYFPIGKTYNVNNTLYLNTKKTLVSDGGCTIKSQRVDRTFPMVVISASAANSCVSGIIFDHNAQGVPEPSLGNALALALLSPLLVMADNVFIDKCSFLNSWDNGLGIGSYTFTGNGSPGSPYSATQTVGSPKGVRVSNCYAFNCGIGEHVTGTPGRIGIGFNALTASQVEFVGCTARYCHTGFGTDFGGQGGATFVGCISREARANAANTNGGNGFYIADGPNVLSGCMALFGDGEGYIVPTEANGVSFSSCYSFANKKQGYVIASSYTTLVGCISQSDSLGNSNVYDAFSLNPYGENMVGVQLVGCTAFGSTHRYGWASNAGAAFSCDAAIMGGHYTGVSGPGNKAGKAISYLDMSSSRVRANPLGGSLEVLGSWDNPIKTATSWIFVDDVGRLRIKTSATAPTSVTDGIIVGSQT